jgi:hypothetical protein
MVLITLTPGSKFYLQGTVQIQFQQKHSIMYVPSQLSLIHSFIRNKKTIFRPVADVTYHRYIYNYNSGVVITILAYNAGAIK